MDSFKTYPHLFKIPQTEVMKMTVVFQVFDWDKVTKSDSIGEAQIPLWQLDLSKETDEWRNLQKTTNGKDKVL